MTAVGNPYDNAQAESFMKTLKAGELYISGHKAFTDVTACLPRFIEHVYNARRMQSSLGYVSPDHFEMQLAQQCGLNNNPLLVQSRGFTPKVRHF